MDASQESQSNGGDAGATKENISDIEEDLKQLNQQISTINAQRDALDAQCAPLIARRDERSADLKAAKAVRKQRNAAKRAELEAAQERARAAQERVRQLQADLEGTDTDDEPEAGVGDATAVTPDTTPSDADTPRQNKRGEGPSGGEQGPTPATKRMKPQTGGATPASPAPVTPRRSGRRGSTAAAAVSIAATPTSTSGSGQQDKGSVGGMSTEGDGVNGGGDCPDLSDEDDDEEGGNQDGGSQGGGSQDGGSQDGGEQGGAEGGGGSQDGGDAGGAAGDKAAPTLHHTPAVIVRLQEEMDARLVLKDNKARGNCLFYSIEDAGIGQMRSLRGDVADGFTRALHNQYKHMATWDTPDARWYGFWKKPGTRKGRRPGLEKAGAKWRQSTGDVLWGNETCLDILSKKHNVVWLLVMPNIHEKRTFDFSRKQDGLRPGVPNADTRYAMLYTDDQHYQAVLCDGKGSFTLDQMPDVVRETWGVVV